MRAQRIESNMAMRGLLWFARVGSLISVGLIVSLFIGEGFYPSRVALQEWIALLLFPVGVVVGMIVAWWREGTGATVSLASLAAFYFVYGFIFRNHIGGWAFIAFTSPGFLFLMHWLLLRGVRKEALR